MSINWGPTVYCIPSQGEKESKRRLTLRRSERSQIKGRREDQRGQKQMGFLHFWDLFGSISSRQLHHPWKRWYLGNRAQWCYISQILCTARVLEGLRSNVHTVKQQYWPYVVSAESKMKTFQPIPLPNVRQLIQSWKTKSRDTGV